ncbi:MAG: RND transporter, partial [Gemmatimonadetes bacterium]|nr:RND transporter [Gemmatimonadota bacterium]
MDIPRRERKSGRKYLYGGVIVGAIVLGTTAVGGLGSGVPSVEGASLWRDVVRRGTMLRQVRGPGTLVPEQIRWVPAVTAGRVERKLVLPGTRVEPGTLLLELSNPDVRLEMLEAERQLSAAQAALVSLRTSLQTLRLSQAAVVASVRAQSLKAQRDARAATQLAENDLMSEAEVA